MAEILPANTTLDMVDEAMGFVTARDLVFERQWFYVAASVLVVWNAFWVMADRHHNELASQRLAWILVLGVGEHPSIPD